MKYFTLALLFSPLLASALEASTMPPTVSNSSLGLSQDEINSMVFTSYDPETDTEMFDITPGLMAFTNKGEYAFDSERVKGKRGIIDLETKSDGVLGLMKRGFKQMIRKIKRSTYKSMEYTWYSGSDLDNPACQDKSTWNPNDNTYVFAADSSSSRTSCGEFVKLCNKAKTKCVWVRRWDDCAACNAAHFDLSPAAFEALGSLDEGVLTGMVAVTSSSKPFSTWTSKYEAMYGPEEQ